MMEAPLGPMQVLHLFIDFALQRPWQRSLCPPPWPSKVYKGWKQARRSFFWHDLLLQRPIRVAPHVIPMMWNL